MPISQNHGCLGRIFKKMSKTLKLFADASFYRDVCPSIHANSSYTSNFCGEDLL